MVDRSVDDILADYTQAQFFPLDALTLTAIDPVSIISAAGKAHSVGKALGLFKDDSVESSLSELGAEINKIYREIAALHQRIDEVRQELIDLVLELDYQNIAADVVGLSKGIGALEGAPNADFLDAAYLDSNPNEFKLLDRLDAYSGPIDRAGLFLRYFDLFVMHAACRLAIFAGSPSLPMSVRVSELLTLRDNLKIYALVARERLFDISRASYNVSLCSRESFNDDDGRVMGVSDNMGYRRSNQQSCTVVASVYLQAGSGSALGDQNRRLRAGAVQKVEAEIKRISRRDADGEWVAKYRLYTELD